MSFTNVVLILILAVLCLNLLLEVINLELVNPILDLMSSLIGEVGIPSTDPSYWNYRIIEYAFAGLLLLITVSFIFKMILKLFK